ncbi:hypothetical protein G6011_02528 [Alternaria panax]|uniref:DUF6594 domain-containing protein n=1 Tax=Alternaria panax TaxID=48097 RepID=A0AAD4FA28_9PLEO|nr:hypothetical protein G6011_02528 [Alternaria panax]
MAMPASVHTTASVSPTASPIPATLPAAPALSSSKPQNEDLLRYIEHSLRVDEDFYFLRFEKLQRTNLVALQMKLIRTKDSMSKATDMSDDDLETLRVTLEQYATAIQNYHCLRKKRTLTSRDAHRRRLLLQRYFHSQVKDVRVFESHYSYFVEKDVDANRLRTLLMKRLPVKMTYSRSERVANQEEFCRGKPPEDVSDFVERLYRFIRAAIGGLFLVGPMLVMAIGPSTAKSLVTVSISVFLFAVVLTFGLEVTDVEGLVSTATYAAVLVVFVGSSTGSGGQ